MNRKKIYNPESTENITDRKIFGGDPTGIFELNDIKFQWAYNLWDLMLKNTWFPKEVDLTADVNDYKLLEPMEKTGYDRVLAQLIFMDSLQTNNIIDNLNPFVTAPEMNLILVRQAFEEALHCYEEGTEVLTSTGFKDFRDLTYDDLVANYQDNGTITFSKPSDIIVGDHNGKMYGIGHSSYYQSVTGNHRVVYQDNRYDGKGSNIKTELAENINLSNKSFPIAGTAIGEKVELSNEDKFRIAFQADGTVANSGWLKDKNYNIYDYTLEDGTYSYIFTFRRKDKILRMSRLLDQLGCKYTVSKTEDDYVKFYVWVTFRCDKDFSWVELDKIHAQWGNSFINELGCWDGSFREEGGVCYSNTNKQAIDKVIEIATLSNTQAKQVEVNTNLDNRQRCWQVHLIRNKADQSGRSMTKQVKDYNGKIYCCTVESGMLVVRFNSNVCISGNSQSYAVMVDSISTNSKEIYDLWRTDKDLRVKNDAVAKVYADLAENPTTKNFIKALYANQILEGIYFYSGFAYLYTLARSGKMLGSAQMIRFIN